MRRKLRSRSRKDKVTGIILGAVGGIALYELLRFIRKHGGLK